MESLPEIDRSARKEVAIAAQLAFLYGGVFRGELKNAKARSRVFLVDGIRNQRYEYRDFKMPTDVLTTNPPIPSPPHNDILKVRIPD